MVSDPAFYLFEIQEPHDGCGIEIDFVLLYEINNFRDIAIGKTGDGIRTAIIDRNSLGIPINDSRAGKHHIGYVANLLVEHLWGK